MKLAFKQMLIAKRNELRQIFERAMKDLEKSVSDFDKWLDKIVPA